MFTVVKAEFAKRAIQVDELLRLVEHVEASDLAARTSTPSVRSLKGLLFVQLYAVYEYVVTTSFFCAVKKFNTHSIPPSLLKTSLLTLVFDSEFKSLQAVSDRKSWPTKINLLANCHSPNGGTLIDEAKFPTDDTHYRIGQLETISSVLGLASGALVVNNRFRGWVNEVVETRNAIAHGRDTAEARGARFSVRELRERCDLLNDGCGHIITVLEGHLSIAANLYR